MVSWIVTALLAVIALFDRYIRKTDTELTDTKGQLQKALKARAGGTMDTSHV